MLVPGPFPGQVPCHEVHGSLVAKGNTPCGTQASNMLP